MGEPQLPVSSTSATECHAPEPAAKAAAVSDGKTEAGFGQRPQQPGYNGASPAEFCCEDLSLLPKTAPARDAHLSHNGKVSGQSDAGQDHGGSGRAAKPGHACGVSQTRGGHQIGASAEGVVSSRTAGQACVGRTASQACVGRTAGQACVGRTASQACGSCTAGQACVGRTAGQACVGRTAGQACVGRTASQACGSCTAGQACVGRTASQACGSRAARKTGAAPCAESAQASLSRGASGLARFRTDGLSACPASRKARAGIPRFFFRGRKEGPHAHHAQPSGWSSSLPSTKGCVSPAARSAA